MIATPWEFALLALAAYRTWKLIADDAILDRPREWTLDRLPSYARDLVECPWCLGAWVTIAWWAAWLAWDDGVVKAAVPFALSAAVGAVATLVAIMQDE